MKEATPATCVEKITRWDLFWGTYDHYDHTEIVAARATIVPNVVENGYNLQEMIGSVDLFPSMIFCYALGVAITGAIVGAINGAICGSMAVPGVGTVSGAGGFAAVGAVIGAIVGVIIGLWKCSRAAYEDYKTYEEGYNQRHNSALFSPPEQGDTSTSQPLLTDSDQTPPANHAALDLGQSP